MQLLERTTGAGRVDRENFVVYGVKVCGLQSQNGREYAESALREAVDLYENKTVNISHPDRTEAHRERSITESPGWLENVRFERGGLFADLHLFESHPSTALILEKAEKNSRGFGLSHNADGYQERVNGRSMITRIDRVRSVDIVMNPATTEGLFESVESLQRELGRQERRHAVLLAEQTESDRSERESTEKTFSEMRSELNQFGRVLDSSCEYDRLTLESSQADPANEYERALSLLESGSPESEYERELRKMRI